MFKNILLLSAFLVVIVSGCQGATGAVQASLDKEFSLAIGQAAELNGDGLTIRFETVQEDSRCPRGATCIWAGRVKSAIQVIENGQSSQVVLNEPGESNEGANGTYKQYRFTSRTLPYPELGKTIIKGNYLLYLTIKKVQ